MQKQLQRQDQAHVVPLWFGGENQTELSIPEPFWRERLKRKDRNQMAANNGMELNKPRKGGFFALAGGSVSCVC